MAGGRTVSIDLVARDLLTGAMEDAAKAVQKLQRNLDELNRRVSVQVDADTERARQGLERTQDEARRLDGKDVNVKVDADTGGAIAGLGAVRAALMGLGMVSLAPVVAGVASMGSALAVAGIGVGGLAAVAIPAFSNIKKAIDAQTQAQVQAGAAAAQSQSRALALAGAEQQVASAVRQAAAAHTQALQQVRQAEDQLAQAHQSEATAARELAQARAEARRQLEDVANNAADAKLAERQAILDVADAQANLNKVMADPKATQLDRERAKLQLDQAKQVAKERHLATQRAIADEKAAQKAGVDGSNAVQQARQRLVQADQAVAAAERQVAQARANVARADQQSADAIASARRSLAAASLQGAGANAALASSMAALSGPERVLMGQALSLKAAFDSWRTALEPQVLPLFGKGLEIIKSILPTLTPFITAASGAIGGFLNRVSAVVNSSAFAGFSKQLAGLVGPTISAALNGVGNILGSLAPLLLTLAQVGAKILGPFLAAVNQVVKALASALRPVLVALAPVFVRLVQALAPLISQLVSGLSPILAGLAPILGRVFAILQPVISQLISGLQPVIQSLVPVVGLLVGALGKILLAIAPILPPLGRLISTLVAGLLPVLTPIVDLIARTAAQIGTALVHALIQCMPALQTIVMAFAKLLPELTPMIPLFGKLVLAILPLLPLIVNLVAKIVTLLMPVLRIAIQAWVRMQVVMVKILIPAIRLVVQYIVWLANQVGVWIPKVGAWFRRLYDTWIKPAMNMIGQVVRGAWENWIRPAFDRISSAVGRVRTAFGTAVDGIKRIWARIQDAAKRPVNFVIGTVFNRGIIGLVNRIASFAGIKTGLQPLPLLARGGTLGNPAKARPMTTKGPMAIVGEGRRQYPEFVIPTDPKFRSRATALWSSAGHVLAGGRWTKGSDRPGGEGIGLASGGVIGGFLKGLKNFSFLDPTKAFKAALGKLMGTVPGSGVFRDVVAALPGWIAAKLVGWFKSKVGLGGGASGPGMARALAWARTQSGKPYQWGGVGNPSWDCSGFMSGITNVIKGRSPFSRLFTTFSFTGAQAGPEGFIRDLRSGFQVGVTNAGVGHMAGTLLGHAVESSGSGGVRVDGGARGADNPLFGMRYGLKADTGSAALAPGWNPVYNGLGRTEYLETPRGSGNSYTINVNVAPGANLREAGRQTVQAIKEYEKGSGKGWRTP